MKCSLVLLLTILAALGLVAASDLGICGAAGDFSMDAGCRSPTAGNALIQSRRTVTAVDPGDGEMGTGASSVAAVAAVAGAEALATGASTGVAAASAVAAVAGAEATQTDALVTAADPSNVSSEEPVYPSNVPSEETSYPSNVPSEETSSQILANETGPSKKTSRPPSPEPRIAQERILPDETGPSKNTSRIPSTEPRIAQERIEPFGYPGAGLVVELHMPKVTLRELHTSSRGSLAEFLLEVRDQLGKGAQVQESRLSILGIHGRYKRANDDGFFRMRSDRTDHMAGSEHMQEEVVVRFEILPGWAQDPDPQSALSVLQQQLSSPDSDLLRGPLGMTLANATVKLSSSAGIASSPGMSEHRGMAHMSAMAWPIGISAAFIGVLIWLAAY